MIETLRDEITRLFEYCYTVVPSYRVPKVIIFVLVICQMASPSFFAAYVPYQVPGSQYQVTTNFLSVLWRIIPTSIRHTSGIYFLFVLTSVLLILFIMLCASARYYGQTAKLPITLSSIISFFYQVLAEWLCPLAVLLAAQSTSDLIWNPDSPPLPAVIVAVVFTALAVLPTAWIVTDMAALSLVFRPMPLVSVTPAPRNFFFLLSILANLVVGIGCSGPVALQFACALALLLVFVGVTYLVFYNGGFVEAYVNLGVWTVGTSSAVMCFIHSIFMIMEQPAELVLVFAHVSLMIVLLLLGRVVLQRMTARVLRFLDEFRAQPPLLRVLASPAVVIRYGVIGFAAVHEACLDWSFFKLAIERWPRDARLWYVFAKFTAIYPEEQATNLQWIFFQVSAARLKGQVAECIRAQALAIMHQREKTQSASLKAKLDLLKKQQLPTKHLLRHVWDVVIQGNIGELEAAAKRAIRAVEQNDADFTHLFRRFPNNKAVAYAYTAFLRALTTDYARWSVMRDKAHDLHRGCAVNMDETHELGLKAFRLLPDRARPKRERQVQGTTTTTTTTTESQADAGGVGGGSESEDETRTDLDAILTIRYRIDELQIPAITAARRLRIGVLVLFCYAPIIFALVYLSIYTVDLPDPLEFLAQISLLNMYYAQIAAFTVRCVGETFGVFRVAGDTSLYGPPPRTLGASWDIGVQLQNALALAARAIENAAAFRSFVGADDARDAFFAGSVRYKYYRSSAEMSENVVSLQSAFVETIVGVEAFAQSGRSVDASVINTSLILNVVGNLQTIGAPLESIRSMIFDSMTDSHNDTGTYTTIALAVGVCMIVGVLFVSLMLQIRWIRSDKCEAYRCLISLPKSEVSKLAQDLRAIKLANEGDGQFEGVDVHGQEENMLKLFNTAASTDHTLGGRWWKIISNVLLGITEIVALVVIVLFVENTTGEIRLSAPHAFYICDSFTGNMVALYGLQRIGLMDTPYSIPITDFMTTPEGVFSRLAKSRNAYDMLSFGENETLPFAMLETFIAQANQYRHCAAAPSTESQLLACYPVDVLTTMIEPVVVRLIGGGKKFDASDEAIEHLWHASISPMYSEFTLPMWESILPATVSYLNGEMSTVIIVAVIVIVVDFLVELTMWFHFDRAAEHVRAVLRLMLGCKADVITNSPKIMNVISGDFSPARSDAINRDTEFLESVYLALPDAVLWADAEHRIRSANSTCAAMFPDNDPVGQNLDAFLHGGRFAAIDPVLLTPSREPRVQDGITYARNAGDVLHLQITVATGPGHTIVFCKERNELFECDSMVERAEADRDRLLLKILPAPLVRKFQKDGKRGANFAVVQCTSIVFINFQAFSFWSASVAPRVALNTLNVLFGLFDAVIAGKPSMMKVKTMGDVYMAAGGIFCEVNSPHEHATEALMFGLEAVAVLARFNSERGLSLAIRVGQHIGGPVFVGVIGPAFENENRPALDEIIKPTFEIIGPAVAMALHLVDNKGIPGRVVMSRAVYLLIDRSQFSIVERSAVVGGNANVADDTTYVANARN